MNEILKKLVIKYEIKYITYISILVYSIILSFISLIKLTNNLNILNSSIFCISIILFIYSSIKLSQTINNFYDNKNTLEEIQGIIV